LDTLGVDPVHIWREKKRTNEKKLRSLDWWAVKTSSEISLVTHTTTCW
jgi:hypothetical protein